MGSFESVLTDGPLSPIGEKDDDVVQEHVTEDNRISFTVYKPPVISSHAEPGPLGSPRLLRKALNKSFETPLVPKVPVVASIEIEVSPRKEESKPIESI